MKTIKLQTESYLFEDAGQQFRAIPFYELSNDEWVVYENGEPKYFLDFNSREKPLIKDLNAQLENGETLEGAVWKLGHFLGREWTIKHNITAKEIHNSAQLESVELLVLEELAALFMDLTFVATDFIDQEAFLNDERLYDVYLSDYTEIQSAYIDNQDNLMLLLSFIFTIEMNLIEVASSDERTVYDLTTYIDKCISIETLDNGYKSWLKKSGRENTMDEYGNLLGIVSYLQHSTNKKHLLLIADRRKHWL